MIILYLILTVGIGSILFYLLLRYLDGSFKWQQPKKCPHCGKEL